MSVVANVALNLDTRGVPQKLREVQNQAQQTERAVGSLGGAIGKLATAFSAIQAAKFVFVSTAEIESQTRSLRVLTGSAEKAAQIVRDLQQLGAATPFTSSELIDAAKRLQAFGVATDNVVETTRRLADVSGATGAELQGLVTAYGQVQAKGRLQGEELLQFQERGVALQKVLKEEYKLSGDEFQKALEKGQISAQAVEYAIRKLTAAGGQYADGAIAQSDTLAGRLSTLQDAVQNLASRLGQILAPAMQSILGLAIDIANQVNNVFETILLQRQLGANLSPTQRDKFFKQAGQEAEQIARLRGRGKIDANQFTQLREERFRDLMRTYGYQQGIIKPPTPTVPGATPTLPGLLAPSSGKGGADKAAREAKRLQEELRKSLETGDKLGVEFSRQVVQLGAAFEVDKKRNEIQFQYEDRARQISELKNAEQRINLEALNTEIRRLEILDLEKQQAEELQDALQNIFKDLPTTFTGKEEAFTAMFDQTLPDAIQKIKDNLKQLTSPTQQIIGAANAIGDAFESSFRGIVSGSMTAQQALANFFQSIADYFMNMAAQIAAEAIKLSAIQILRSIFMPALGGGFGVGGSEFDLPGLSGAGALRTAPLTPGGIFAEGGYVTGPTRALIGEAGQPEYVIPASKMRGAMNRYAAGARGSAVIPAGGGGDGGTATMAAAPAAIDVRYTVERINSVDYVTADQFQRGMQQAATEGAMRGEQRALSTLRQNTTQRRKIGL